jgi:defect-in-organelle-trafficking protein DotC
MKKLLILAGACLVIAGCTNTRPAAINTTNLSQIEGLTAENAPISASSELASNIRLQAIKETALSLGARAGLAAKSQQINKVLDKNAQELSQVFNFRALMLPHNVMPPVLEQSNQLVHVANMTSIRLANKTYRIVQQAHFVSTPPNWRQYLYMNYKKPTVPDKTLLPRNAKEQAWWIYYIKKGWKEGTAQAKTIYLDNLAELETDYKGMLLYNELRARNIISKPYVATAKLGTTTNAHQTQLYLNDEIMRITSLPKLNPDMAKWKAVITQ